MKKKKILKNILAVACAMTAFVAFAACDFGQKEVVNAYDIAVKNGFTGTEEEWLASLKGADGNDAPELDIGDIYEVAKENGYKGTFLEFLKEYLDVEAKEDNDTAQIAENVMSVVSIYCGFSKTTWVSNGFPYFNTEEKKQYYSSAGSGVIIDLNKEAGNALIVTNYHVIYDADSDTETNISDSIWLYTYGALNMFSSTTGKNEGGDGIRATYVGGAMDYDIAVIKVEGAVEELKNSTEAKLGDSEEVKIGEKVFAIGNPSGAGIAVTSGVISVDSEYIVMESTDGEARQVQYRVMRTDAAINHGNSGGALFNAKGELIGITNAKSVEEEVDNMGYALPITQVKNLIDNALDNGGVVKRAMLGIEAQTTASRTEFDESGNLVIIEEFTVSKESKQGSAAYNKLKYGDVIKSIELHGEKISLTRRYQLNDLLLKVRKGDSLVLNVIRDGSETAVTIVYDQDAYFTDYQ